MAGLQRKQFTKGYSNNNNKYQDPTYLTFMIIFDTSSALFNKEVAVKSLREQYGETTRATLLEKFIDTLILINKEMPWYWTALDGVEKVFEMDQNEPFRGGDDSILTLNCNESINLPITGLMDLYRDAVWDAAGWKNTLPENYLRFNMDIIVSEVREIQTTRSSGVNGIDEQINSGITADVKPMFKIRYEACHFDINSTKETFSALNRESPEQPKPIIKINYNRVRKSSASYLHEMSGQRIADGESIGTEDVNSPNDKSYSDLNGTDSVYDTQNVRREINLINNRSNNVYGTAIDRAFENLVRQGEDIVSGIGRMPENLLKDSQAQARNEATSFLRSAKNNIFGIDGSSTVDAAIRQGSINSIFPIINNTTGSNNNGDLGNTFGK